MPQSTRSGDILEWRESSEGFRVWKQTWFNDQFEILTEAEFRALQVAEQTFPWLFRLIEAGD